MFVGQTSRPSLIRGTHPSLLVTSTHGLKSEELFADEDFRI